MKSGGFPLSQKERAERVDFLKKKDKIYQKTMDSDWYITESITIDKKNYKIRLLFGDELLTNEDVCFDAYSSAWRFIKLRNNITSISASVLLKSAFSIASPSKIGRIITKRKIG